MIKTSKKQFVNQVLDIDVSLLPAGIYFIELLGQNYKIQSKFIKL